jgi:hypothetical protein
VKYYFLHARISKYTIFVSAVTSVSFVINLMIKEVQRKTHDAYFPSNTSIYTIKLARTIN